jgi:protein-tyrosine phosphatase
VPFTVLFVCTGNVCRSPSAELLFQASVGGRGDVVVHSAGTHALVNAGIDGPTATVLTRLGFDPTRHRGAQFVPPMAREADLILTAAREHRDSIITQVPTAYRRTFTMKEFARLVHSIPTGTEPRAVITAAHLARPTLGPVPAADDDIPDPFRGTVTRAWDVAEQVVASVGATARGLGFLHAAGTPSEASGR